MQVHQDVKMQELKEKLIYLSCQTFFLNSIYQILCFPKNMKNMLFAPRNFGGICFILGFSDVYSMF